MKGKNRLAAEYILAGLFGLFILFAYILDWNVGREMARNFYDFSLKLIVLVPSIFAFIGILDVWIPKETIERHIGEDSGIRGAFYVVLLAFFQGGPLYVAFPVAHLLWKKGCSLRNVFVYIGSFSALKIPMVMFEISFLGWKFSLIRATVSLPVFLLIALIMDKKTRGRYLPMERM